jgi:hypothetical protein
MSTVSFISKGVNNITFPKKTELSLLQNPVGFETASAKKQQKKQRF